MDSTRLASATMSEVASAIERVTQIMDEISSANSEQSTGMAQPAGGCHGGIKLAAA